MIITPDTVAFSLSEGTWIDHPLHRETMPTVKNKVRHEWLGFLIAHAEVEDAERLDAWRHAYEHPQQEIDNRFVRAMLGVDQGWFTEQYEVVDGKINHPLVTKLSRPELGQLAAAADKGYRISKESFQENPGPSIDAHMEAARQNILDFPDPGDPQTDKYLLWALDPNHPDYEWMRSGTIAGADNANLREMAITSHIYATTMRYLLMVPPSTPDQEPGA